MHAYLISGGTSESRFQKAHDISQSLSSKLVTYEIKKIADVRELEKHTRLSLNEKTTFILPSIDEASEESQNALLKALEEPQDNVHFILTAQNEHSVIPTITSRCEQVHLVTVINSDNSNESFLHESVGEKLSHISKITDRDEAVKFVDHLIMSLHSTLLSDNNLKTVAHNLSLSSKTYQNLKKNGNVNLQLTNLCIQME